MAKPPVGLKWRSSTTFIIATVAIGLFTDLFLYGLVVPVLPFMLRNRIGVPQEDVQGYVSALLAAFAGASVICSVPAGWVADRTDARQIPFLSGLVALLISTIMLAFGKSIAVLIVSRILQGMSGAVVWTVGLAMVLDTVGPEHLGKVIGTIFSFISTGELAAPVLGGVLYDKTGYAGVFGIGAGVLAVDFIMRILLIEKKTAAKWGVAQDQSSNPREQTSRTNNDEAHEDEDANEQDALLPKREEERYKISQKGSKVFHTLPILYCFSDPRLLVAMWLALIQATLLATFDTTIPTEAESLFGFSALKSGLLFIALDIPYLVLGPVAGWAVDKYGPKLAAVVGFGYLVPVLCLLRLPGEHLVASHNNIVLYCCLLVLTGVGFAIIGSPSLVEASDVVQRYDKANPGVFGKNGPYAQLYGFNSLVFSTGLTIGPILSGLLRNAIGYGNMNAIMAAISAVTALLSFIYTGGKPKVLKKRR